MPLITPTPVTPATESLPPRRLLTYSLPAAVVAGIFALVVGALYSGAFAETPLIDPGTAVRWGLPMATLAAEFGAALTIGGLVLSVGVVRLGVATRSSLTIASVGAAVWAVGILLRMLLTFSTAVGLPPTDPSFSQGLSSYVFDMPAGRAYLFIILIAVAVSTLALAVNTPTGAAWATALALGALGIQAEMGHAAESGNHHLSVGAMFLHLAGAAAWIGALAVIAILWLRHRLDGADLATVISRYSSIAGWSIGLVAVSGVVSSLVRLGGLSGLGSKYGVLIIVKVALLLVLAGFGGAHRRWVVSRLRFGDRAGALLWRLVAAEFLVMGLVSGVAVALGSSSPPDDGVRTGPLTAAEIVTRETLPPEPTFANWFTLWRPDLLFATVAAAGLIVYIRWVMKLRKRGDSWSIWRTISWCIGMVFFAWITSGGPALYGYFLFSSHMLQHMLLAMVIPIFLTSGAPITLAMRALPVRKDDTRGPREWLMTLVHSRWGTFFANPIVAAANFAGSMIIFYYTPAFEYALTTSIGHVLMVVHFSLAGYLFVNALIGIDPGPARPGYPQRLLLLLATMAFHAFFGVSLMSGETLLVANWFGLMGRPWGDSAIVDQQTGGGLAWGIGEVPTVLLALIVVVRWAASDKRDAKRKDRQAQRDGDAELNEYNEMLARLAEQDK